MSRFALVSVLGLASVTAAALSALPACSSDETREVENGTTGGSTTGGGTTGGTTEGSGPLTDFVGDAQVQGGTKISANRTLTKDKTWHMKGVVYVPAGVTLTIEAGTVIKGDKAQLGTLVIQPGGKLIANGTADEPIVFTSLAASGQKQAGDWGGVIVLGKARINGGKATDAGIAQEAYIEGLTVTPENQYGGQDDADSSGSLKYVRIEYSGAKIGADNEINGLTFGGVGSGTVVDHIMVRHTLDDCFEFFGGSVSAKYLVCAYNQDDGFDADNGFSGKLQFLVLQQDAKFDDEMNGFEWDNDALGTNGAPVTNPTVYNFTFCGQDATGGAKRKFGALLRRSTAGTIRNGVVWGFDAAMDIRDKATHARVNGGSPALSVQNSQFFKFTGPNLDRGLAVTETKADELLFGEVDYLLNAANNDVTDQDPGFNCKDQENPNFVPTTVITDKAVAPPNDGFFDSSAKYMGAFKDSSDKWATTGKWVAWTKSGF